MIWPFRNGPFSGWFERRRSLRELQRMMAHEDGMIALQDDNPLRRAKVSMETGDAAAARHFLQIARERLPGYVLTSPDTIDVLIGLGDFAEAERFALEGAKRFPRQPHYLEGYALAAERRRDFATAAERWAAVRKRFPSRKSGYINGIGCLRQCGQLDAADTLLRRAMRLLPDDLTLLFERGRVAEARGDWAEAYRRWDSVRSKHPAGIVGAAQALHKLGRTAEAQALLAEGRASHPMQQTIAMTQAFIAEEIGDKATALEHWARFRQRFPLDRAGYVDGLRVLRDQMDWAEADTVAQAAISRFPQDAWPLAEYAGLAHARGDWPEAASRWAAVRAAFPEREDAYRRGAEALVAAGQPEAAAQLLGSTSPPA